MSKADVLNLIDVISVGQADAVLADRFYDEAINALGPDLWLSTVTLQTLTAATDFTLPDTLRVLAAIIWDDSQLGRLSLRELEALDDEWRSRSGTPVAWNNEDSSVKSISFYPSPFTASDANLGATGTPLGQDYPTYSAVLFHSEYRPNVPDYLTLPLAYMVLEREYSRESDHVDPVMAMWCGQMAKMMLELLK